MLQKHGGKVWAGLCWSLANTTKIKPRDSENGEADFLDY
jgi:hypothetical protein